MLVAVGLAGETVMSEPVLPAIGKNAWNFIWGQTTVNIINKPRIFGRFVAETPCED